MAMYRQVFGKLHRRRRQAYGRWLKRRGQKTRKLLNNFPQRLCRDGDGGPISPITLGRNAKCRTTWLLGSRNRARSTGLPSTVHGPRRKRWDRAFCIGCRFAPGDKRQNVNAERPGTLNLASWESLFLLSIPPTFLSSFEHGYLTLKHSVTTSGQHACYRRDHFRRERLAPFEAEWREWRRRSLSLPSSTPCQDRRWSPRGFDVGRTTHGRQL